MINNKLINLGALALFAYCIYEYRTNGYKQMPDTPPRAIHSAKYNIDWDLDPTKPHQSTTEFILNYMFSDKIKAIKDSVVSDKEPKSTVQSLSPHPDAAMENDVANVSYTIIQDDGSSQTFTAENMVLQKSDWLGGFVIGMLPDSEKTVILTKTAVLPDNITIRGQEASMKITLTSIANHNNG